MKNLEELWGRIGSVTKTEVIIAVLKDEIEICKSRIQPSGTGTLYTTISTLEHRIKELENGEEEDLTTEFNGEGEDKVAVFGGGSSTSITNEQFDELKTIVSELRTSIIEGSL